MKKVLDNKQKKRRKLIILLIVLLVIVALVMYVKKKMKEATEILGSMFAYNVEEIQNRDLVESISATGVITSNSSNDVIANVSNVEIMEVLVDVGDEVKAGDVICILDSEGLNDELNNTEISKDVTTKKANANIAASSRNLKDAKTVDNTSVDRDYEDAQLRYQDYLQALSELDQAKREYDTAVEYYNFREKEYNDYRESYKDYDEYDFLNKTEKGNYYKGNVTAAENDKNSKKASVDSKQKAVDNALENYNKLIRSYEDHLRTNNNTIMNSKDSVNSASWDSETANLNNNLQIKKYEKQIEACTVVAPSDGIITALNAKEGLMYTGNALATIEDIDSYKVSVEIDEYDISKIKVGQKVVIKTNGTGDEEFEGKVSYIAPKATKQASGTQATNVTYKVEVDIEGSHDELKLDMTAKVAIVINEVNNVLTVPYDAVLVDENGDTYIEVVRDDSQDAENKPVAVDVNNKEKLYVTKGVESDYYIEITGDGVKEGLKVAIPTEDGVNELVKMLQEQGVTGGM